MLRRPQGREKLFRSLRLTPPSVCPPPRPPLLSPLSSNWEAEPAFWNFPSLSALMGSIKRTISAQLFPSLRAQTHHPSVRLSESRTQPNAAVRADVRRGETMRPGRTIRSCLFVLQGPPSLAVHHRLSESFILAVQEQLISRRPHSSGCRDEASPRTLPEPSEAKRFITSVCVRTPQTRLMCSLCGQMNSSRGHFLSAREERRDEWF